jgi:NAD(P)H-dependent FMN reductase
VQAQATTRTGAEYKLIDLADYPLPRLDETASPNPDQSAEEPSKAWAAAVASFDGFIFVTPEYTHSTTSVLNAIDGLHGKWSNKAAAFVSYGSHGGARAIEDLRAVTSQLQIAHVSQQLSFSLTTEFEPNASHHSAVETLFDQLESWAGALRAVCPAA